MNKISTQSAVISSLSFFDLFDHPLTAEELIKYAWEITVKDGSEWRELLDEMVLNGVIEFHDGYYFLPGRAETVAKRQGRVKLVESKMKIALAGVRKLRYVPFVRAIFVCNTLSLGAVDDDSDIDVMIVVKAGRLWLARFLATFLLQIFGLRRTKKKITNRVCLSFYLTDQNLNLSAVALPAPDIYLVHWLEWLVPIFDPDNLRSSVLRANDWAKKHLPNAFGEYNILARWRVNHNSWSQGGRKFWERVWAGSYGDLLEDQAKKAQLAKMRLGGQVKNQVGTGVVINDKMLKFHENDRREEYKRLWQEKISG